MRKMYTLTVLGAVFMTTVICNSAVGQTACPGTYERADRPAMIAYYESASFDLQVLASLAEDAASQWFIDEDLGVDDPQVHKNVYNTFRSYLFSRGTLHNNQLSAKGNQFVAAVFNNNFLQIPDLFPDGELSHPIAYYAREALDKINGATANLELCLRSSWDRMDVTDNTVGSCRSGFSLSDLGKVLTQYVKIISKLFDIREIVRKSAYGVFSITQRKILDADLRYQLEEMAILRNTKVTGVTPLTQRFLKILISSQLLGIKNPVIVGRYEQEAINNSLNSLLAIERGFEAAGACIAVNAYRPER